MTKIINLTPYNITIVQGVNKRVIKAPEFAHETAYVYKPDGSIRDMNNNAFNEIPLIQIDENLYLPDSFTFNEDDDAIFIVTEHVARVAAYSGIPYGGNKNMVFPFEYIVDDMELTNPNMTVFKFALIE